MRKTREVAIFVYRGDRHLVAHRAGDGHWNVIAGQVEDGETFEQAAVRELDEEAALTAPLVDLGLVQDYEVDAEYLPLYATGEHMVRVASFAAAAPAGWEPTLNHEHDEYRWCSLEEALALLFWPGVKDGLRAVAARLAPVLQPSSMEVNGMRCAHCDTLITDESTIAKRDGKTFCCNNCATAYMRAQEAPDETLTTGGGRTPTNAPLTR